jgi:hypothetical protein
MNSDFKDLLQILHDCDVHYLVCGGYAVIHYAQPRYTKDIDLWIAPNPGNASKLMRAFHRFGIPLHGVTQADFASPGLQFSLGRAPCEIDFLTLFLASILKQLGPIELFHGKEKPPSTTSVKPISS